MAQIIKAKEVVKALDIITGGRIPKDIYQLYSGTNPFVVVKSSNLPGKSVMETPGFVCGDSEKEIKKLAVIMTMTESKIELAGATGVDAIIAHHPVADAANSGGVLMKTYLGLYGINVFELHEAFHGLHPGISFLHGHAAYRVDIAYGGIPGNCCFVGKALVEVNTLGDILDRIRDFMDVGSEEKLLDYERELRGCSDIYETNVNVVGKILVGDRDSKVNHILHIFPHTGFTPQHLDSIKKENPEIDTVLASISRVHGVNPLVDKCKELGLNFILGNSHATEILENGLPLAKALKKLLPSVEVILFRERVTSFPVDNFGSKSIQEYSEMIASKYLVKEK
jgi:hypothetical protein